MKELMIPATIENIEMVVDFVDQYLEELNCPMKTQLQINIAIDELFGNIVRYAYSSEGGTVKVQVEAAASPLAVSITLIDEGIPFDPLSSADPDITLSAEERQIGGLGIYMAKKTMDEITYKYENGKNILTIKKKMHVSDL